MNEENSDAKELIQNEWQAPPIPEQILATSEQPQMSEAATLGSIFFEPGATFEDLRRKPRFILATLIMIVLITLFNVLFINKVGFEEIIRARLETSSRVQQMSAEEKQKMIDVQTGPVVKAISYAAPPIFIIVFFLLGTLLYWGGVKAMGGDTTFLRALSVWVYSSFPAVVISMLANILILFLKSTDDIDIATSQNGLVHANPSFFMDGKAMPVLTALIGTLDVFFMWGWILAAIGLRIVGKISSGAAWAIVLIVALINVSVRVIGAFFS